MGSDAAYRVNHDYAECIMQRVMRMASVLIVVVGVGCSGHATQSARITAPVDGTESAIMASDSDSASVTAFSTRATPTTSTRQTPTVDPSRTSGPRTSPAVRSTTRPVGTTPTGAAGGARTRTEPAPTTSAAPSTARRETQVFRTPLGSTGPHANDAPAPTPTRSGGMRAYPWHHDIVATTFWIGEVFEAGPDGSQVISTYDDRWMEHYGGCDGVVSNGVCQTEHRSAANGYFPTRMVPKENPFYVDLPYDDVNDPIAAAERADVIPWATDRENAAILADPDRSLMKDRWVEIRHEGRVCYGQVEDAGPGEYHDAAYVFGSARPMNSRFGGAGMDVSPALNGCLRFSEPDGDSDRVSWRFVDAAAVPDGPWLTVVTTS